MTQRDGAKTGIPTIMDKDGKCHSSYTDWLKYTTWNMYKWYDETPYDTTDDKAYDAGFLKDGSVGVNGKKEDDQPCKWDGSTNKIKGCPKMVRWYGKSFLIRGLFDDCLMQGTKCEHTLKYFDGATRRPLEWEWKKKAVKKGIKTFMYQIPEKHFKGSHENAKYGMPASGASFVDFPGDGAWPMQRVTAAHMGGVPIVLTRPHWLGGGAKAKQWNEEMGLRQPLNSLDNFEIYFEPTTGFPIDAKIQWQFNTMFRPANLKLHTGDANSPTVFDYSNLTLHNGETINLATLGKYRGCPDAETKGCPIMIPNYILSLELNWSANLAEKIKKIAAIMKKLGTFKFLMKFWAWGGMMGIFCVISCLSYHFFMSDNRKK